MIVSLIATFFLYGFSMVFLPEYFGERCTVSPRPKVPMLTPFSILRSRLCHFGPLRLEGCPYCCHQVRLSPVLWLQARPF